MAYEIEGCQVIWVVKHENISMPFLDAAASQFLLRSGLVKRKNASIGTVGFGDSGIESSKEAKDKATPLIRLLRYSHMDHDPSSSALQLVSADSEGAEKPDKSLGSALGPDWAQGKRFTGLIDEETLNRPLKVYLF